MEDCCSMIFKAKVLHKILSCENRPSRNFVKGSEESAAHSDRLDNSRKTEASPPCGLLASHCKLELFFDLFGPFKCHTILVQTGKCFLCII